MRAAVLVFAALVVPTLASAQSETVEYYGQDAVGSIRIVFDGSGTVTARQDYAPFGRTLVPAFGMPAEGFVGNTTDGESDQGYFHARQYQTRTGRFGAVDPIYKGLFEPQGWNRYSYALNRPLVFVDRMGLDCPPGSDTYCVDVYGSASVASFWTGFASFVPNDTQLPAHMLAMEERLLDRRSRTNTTSPTSDPPPTPTPPPNPPGPACDPKTGQHCTPFVNRDLEFLKGAWDSLRRALKGDPNSCVSQYVSGTLNNLVPISPSWASASNAAAFTLGARQVNQALEYAAARPNYVGGTGLLYPFKSSAFRGMYRFGVDMASDSGAFVVGLGLAEFESLKNEIVAGFTGNCR